jgi:hypothetical protein
VHLEEDPWIGCKGDFRLSEALLSVLHNQGIFILEDAASNNGRNVWDQGWKQVEYLSLQRAIGEEWNQLIRILNSGTIGLNEYEDQIKWSKNHGSDEYTAKLD